VVEPSLSAAQRRGGLADDARVLHVGLDLFAGERAVVIEVPLGEARAHGGEKVLRGRRQRDRVRRRRRLGQRRDLPRRNGLRAPDDLQLACGRRRIRHGRGRQRQGGKGAERQRDGDHGGAERAHLLDGHGESRGRQRLARPLVVRRLEGVQSQPSTSVMAGLVPAIHVFAAEARRGCPHSRA
jgi:hypothetical protein